MMRWEDNMAAALTGGSGRSNTQLTRSLERILDEAQLTGELHLSGRNFKEFPKVASKYDLYDTVSADLSKNRLSELPHEICDFFAIERIDCYHNAIRSIPDSITRLQCLTHLNLSRNQLTTIPSVVCELQNLSVLVACHNKLVSLPEEIRLLQKLMELDVSCNEISHLPPQIGFLKSLRALHLRRNMLVELPIEITALRLVLLDISSNRIVYLPTRLRIMDSLVDLILENNPLSSPPAYLCTRGKVHIFKFLDMQAQKEDRKKGVLGLECDYKRQWRTHHSVDHRLNGLTMEPRHKRPPVDSGYCTSEGDMRWMQDSQEVTSDTDEGRKHIIVKDKRHDVDKEFPKMTTVTSAPNVISGTHSANPVPPQNGNLTNLGPPSAFVSNIDVSFENEINRRTQARREMQEVNGDDHEEALLADERRKTAAKIWEQQHEEARRSSSQRNVSTATPSSIFSPRDSYVNSNDAADGPSAVGSTNERSSNPLAHIQTYREYKEALKMQRSYEANNVYRRAPSDTGVGMLPVSDGFAKVDVTCFPRPPPMGAPASNHSIAEEEYQLRTQESYSHLQQQRYEAQISQLRLEDEKRKQKQLQKEAVLSYVKSRTSPLKNSTDSDQYTVEDYGSKLSSPSLSPCPPPLTISTSVQSLSSSLTQHSPCSPPPPPPPPPPPVPLNGTIHHPPRLRYTTAIPTPQHITNYTLRRETERSREGKEQIEQLRQAIEMRLKVSLPDDLASALTDGVVLCHLANHVRPRSVASIHVPSPAVPKLTVAKCRRNVENFLEACRRIGVAEEHLCSHEDILNGLPKPRNVLETVQQLMKSSQFGTVQQQISRLSLSSSATSPTRGQDDVLIAWLCVAIFFGSCLLLYFLPENV